jgi:hypothetical protein
MLVQFAATLSAHWRGILASRTIRSRPVRWRAPIGRARAGLPLSFVGLWPAANSLFEQLSVCRSDSRSSMSLLEAKKTELCQSDFLSLGYWVAANRQIIEVGTVSDIQIGQRDPRVIDKNCRVPSGNADIVDDQITLQRPAQDVRPPWKGEGNRFRNPGKQAHHREIGIHAVPHRCDWLWRNSTIACLGHCFNVLLTENCGEPLPLIRVTARMLVAGEVTFCRQTAVSLWAD